MSWASLHANLQCCPSCGRSPFYRSKPRHDSAPGRWPRREQRSVSDLSGEAAGSCFSSQKCLSAFLESPRCPRSYASYKFNDTEKPISRQNHRKPVLGVFTGTGSSWTVHKTMQHLLMSVSDRTIPLTCKAPSVSGGNLDWNCRCFVSFALAMQAARDSFGKV